METRPSIKEIMMRVNLLLIVLSVFVIIGCAKKEAPEMPAMTAPEAMTPSEKFLYTSTNDPTGNHVIAMAIGGDGLLTEIYSEAGTAFPTGGTGDADDGDFDGQHAIYIIPGTSYLLVVNAGDAQWENSIAEGHGSVSVFEIDGDSGQLARIDQSPSTVDSLENIDSGGVRPISIGSTVIDGQTWVLVANQYHNPFWGGNSRTDGLLNTPPGDPTDATKNTAARNITAFKFNDGVLSSPTTVVTYESGDHGGPTQVAFSPDGTKAAVTTWGLAQFGEGVTTNADVQGTSRLYVYDVSGSADNLTLTNGRHFEHRGVSGSIGYSWASDSDGVYIANFNLALTPESYEDYGVTSVSTGASPELLSHAEIPGVDDEACWTWLSPDGTRLYAASFAKNKVSYFEVSPDHELTHKQTLVRRDVPAADTKDMFITSDGKHFYVSGALMSHTISIYVVGPDGTLTEVAASPYKVPSSHPGGENVSPMSQAYLGLTGY
jgi:hypothetical protein